MPPTTPRLRILSVGGNAVSAFLSWRLSATQACDVTLVWKNGFDAVHQYGISFRSDKFGNERFKPRHVVRVPEEAAGPSRASFDYVLLCVKALPDVYDLASVIESVVSPQHTCILVNTTHTLGIESYLEQRFPTNVVLSLVSGAEITQLGASEFEHKGSTELHVGAANKNPSIPASIQGDMAEALAMTLKSGQVDCEVSPNIRQQQYERMTGPIAFYPISVLFETPVHAALLEKNGVRSLVTGVIDELMNLAQAQGCSFTPDFKETTMEKMIVPSETNSIMYQDFTARRPMEVETYLGSPMKLAQEIGLQVPRIETLYALLHNVNTVNQTRPQHAAGPPSPPPQPTPRMSSAPMPNGPPMPFPNGRGPPPSMRNGMRPGNRAPSQAGGPPGMRRGPPSMSGYPPPGRMNGNGWAGPRGPPQQNSRRPSFEGNDLEEFSHLMLYDNMPDGGEHFDGMPSAPSGDLGLRERELALRQKELALREREYHMRSGGRRVPPPRDAYDEDEEDGDDFFDPSMVPAGPGVDPDQIDMMSVTSRRTRKAPSASQLRNNPEMMGAAPAVRSSRGPMMRRPKMPNRTSAALMSEMPNLREELMNNPLMGYSSDRFGTVDRMNMGQESRANSLTAERLNELQHGGPPNGFPPHPNGYPMNRRGSQSPGNPLSPGQRPPQRPSPPNGYGPPGRNGRPSPPGMRQPVPRHPPGHGNAVAPQQIEQQTGVSNLYPPKSGPPNQVRSLTGSASASTGSGDSNRSARIDSEPSAHTSSSSLGPRPPVGVR
ncbi:Meiotically up-regulated 72 [Lecanosticta acicola]|uniref:Meiotically up-regulated 72 n=1 Tax=Lecanosticta acicola TaxID=111012 RepID=A0AAI8YXI5_9PEZI|nr:Meiotically up-regulated 72 [Lecanosticta acicola]